MLKLHFVHPDFTRKTSWNTRKAHSIILYLDQTLTHVNLLDSTHGRCYQKILKTGFLSPYHPGHPPIAKGGINVRAKTCVL
jgi:hypothetical protein